MKKIYAVFFGLAVLASGCHCDPISDDIIERAAKFVKKDMSSSPLEENLADWEKEVLKKLIKASEYMDEAYWQQVDPEGRKLFDCYAKSKEPKKIAARHMMDVNYGKWDRFREFEPFIGNQTRPVGSYVYPSDLTLDELNAYIEMYPEQKEDLLSPYTVVRREGDRLAAIAYHIAFEEYVEPAATLLDEAAAISQNQSLTDYLLLQASGLRTDDYFEANLAWLDLDSNIDLSFGPHEVYDDMLTAQKTFYKSNVLIVDQDAAGQFEDYKAMIPELQQNLPVDPKYKPAQEGTMTPMILADDIRRSGQVRAIMTAVAFSLPNDPRVLDEKGAKKVMMGNYLSARYLTVLEPLSRVVLCSYAIENIDYDSYFTWVLMHEITHTLGPREVIKEGKKMTVSEALGQYYPPIEEGKADIGGLYNLPYLIEKGVVKGSLVSHYVGYLAEALRSIRFGMGSPYGVIRSAVWNFFVQEGALSYDSSVDRFKLDDNRMIDAVEKLIIKLIEIEGEGDSREAEEFINTYSFVGEELKRLFETADETVPLEFIPVYNE